MTGTSEFPLRDGFYCAVCKKPLIGIYYMCDEEMKDYCPDCFWKTPCGRGDHGEGCPTKVFA